MRSEKYFILADSHVDGCEVIGDRVGPEGCPSKYVPAIHFGSHAQATDYAKRHGYNNYCIVRDDRSDVLMYDPARDEKTERKV